MPKKLLRYEVCYYDDSRAADIVTCGHWELMQAERKFYVGCIQKGDLDAMTFMMFLGAKRCQIIPEGVNYDAWASTIATITDVTKDDEADGLGESQAPLET